MRIANIVIQIAALCGVALCTSRVARGQLGPVPEDLAMLEREARASALVDAGNKLLEDGKLDPAVDMFKQAVAIDSYSMRGWHGMARAETKKDNLAEALAAYRHLVARDIQTGLHRVNGPPAVGTKLEMAIVLSRLGQQSESLELYYEALSILNYADSSYWEPVPLTLIFRPGPGALRYSPQVFAAVARVALGIAIKSDGITWRDDPIDEFRAAVKLQPRLAIAQFYLGLGLSRLSRVEHTSEIVAEQADALRKAALYGDSEIKRAVRELQTDGKITPPKVSPKTRRAELGLGHVSARQ